MKNFIVLALCLLCFSCEMFAQEAKEAQSTTGTAWRPKFDIHGGVAIMEGEHYGIRVMIIPQFALEYSRGTIAVPLAQGDDRHTIGLNYYPYFTKETEDFCLSFFIGDRKVFYNGPQYVHLGLNCGIVPMEIFKFNFFIRWGIFYSIEQPQPRYFEKPDERKTINIDLSAGISVCF